MDTHVHYYVNNSLLTTTVEATAPHMGELVRIDGTRYKVTQTERRITMCPPWVVVVWLGDVDPKSELGAALIA